jgi:hypothetical protein
LYIIQNVIRPVDNYIFCKKKYNLTIYKMAELAETDPLPNVDPAGEVVLGNVYVITATGGFEMERGFAPIALAEQTAPEVVDVTNSVQIAMSKTFFNGLLDLSSYNTVDDKFGVDEITISAEDLTAEVTTAGQILSVGAYADLYTDFTTYVQQYFGNTGGFESLFTAASEFDAGEVFDGDAFIALLTGSEPDASGNYVSDLSGSITISNIASMLKYIVDGNTFGNRDPDGPTDWGVANGFVAGDLIWVPDGISIALKLAIDMESFLPVNNIGPSKVSTETVESLNYSVETSATTELITRVAKAPLLIQLIDA